MLATQDYGTSFYAEKWEQKKQTRDIQEICCFSGIVDPCKY